MSDKHYARDEALGLLPLLGSIGKEIEERNLALAAIEAELAALAAARDAASARRTRDLVAEAATHRRALRHSREELDRLGCTVVGNTPLTFRIPCKDGQTSRSFVWQTGEPLPR